MVRQPTEALSSAVSRSNWGYEAAKQSELARLTHRKSATTHSTTTRPLTAMSGRWFNSKPLQDCLNGLSPWNLTIDQVNQGAWVEERDHQSRSATNSASISNLLREAVDGDKNRNHCNADASTSERFNAGNFSWWKWY